MANKVKIKRGLKATLPVLDVGEQGFCTDTNEYVLGSSTGNVFFSNKEEIASQLAQIVNYVTPYCSVYHNVNQSAASNVFTTLSFNSERADTKGMHDLSNNNSRLTCKESGKYLITANVTFSMLSAVGVRSLSLRLNGNTFIAHINNTPPAANVEVGMNVSTIIELNENDYVEVVVYQATGSSLNINYTGDTSPEFKMIKVG
jgi:hypothetical protein